MKESKINELYAENKILKKELKNRIKRTETAILLAFNLVDYPEEKAIEEMKTIMISCNLY